jgi:hypothetical protein
MSIRQLLRVAGNVIVTLLLCTTAHAAGLFRAYLSFDGDDANPCTLLQPCRLLPAALNAVAAGGEIWMVDSANYGTGINITKSVTILAVPGALGSVTANGGDAIKIATPGVIVALRNLAIVPVVGSGGVGMGINMTAGAKLTVESCLIANLPSFGIRVITLADVRITDTTIRDNHEGGLLLYGGAQATITRATISGNRDGVNAYGTSADITTADIGDSTVDGNIEKGVRAASPLAGGIVKVSVHDSRIIRNGDAGVDGGSSLGGSTTLSISNNIIANNGTGIGGANSGTKVWASGNTVSNNGQAGLRSESSALFESAGNNAVRNNGTDTSGPITVIATK